MAAIVIDDCPLVSRARGNDILGSDVEATAASGRIYVSPAYGHSINPIRDLAGGFVGEVGGRCGRGKGGDQADEVCLEGAVCRVVTLRAAYRVVESVGFGQREASDKRESKEEDQEGSHEMTDTEAQTSSRLEEHS